MIGVGTTVLFTDGTRFPPYWRSGSIGTVTNWEDGVYSVVFSDGLHIWALPKEVTAL